MHMLLLSHKDFPLPSGRHSLSPPAAIVRLTASSSSFFFHHAALFKVPAAVAKAACEFRFAVFIFFLDLFMYF